MKQFNIKLWGPSIMKNYPKHWITPKFHYCMIRKRDMLLGLGRQHLLKKSRNRCEEKSIYLKPDKQVTERHL
jgi:hypothetical protein